MLEQEIGTLRRLTPQELESIYIPGYAKIGDRVCIVSASPNDGRLGTVIDHSKLGLDEFGRILDLKGNVIDGCFFHKFDKKNNMVAQLDDGSYFAWRKCAFRKIQEA